MLISLSIDQIAVIMDRTPSRAARRRSDRVPSYQQGRYQVAADKSRSSGN